MKKVFFLSTCNTCTRIIKEVAVDESFETQDIKHEQINAEQLEALSKIAGSYEALFSRTARKYRERNLKEQTLGEEDYKKLILEEYTFLKRPVFVIGDKIFIGNSKKNVQAIKDALKNL